MRFAASPGFQNAMSAVSGVGIDYNDLTGAAQKGRSMQQQTALSSEGKLRSTEEEARGMVESAKHMAAATRAQGAAAGQASMVSGLASGISGLAGGIGGMGGGGLTIPSASALNTAQNEFNTFFKAGNYLV